MIADAEKEASEVLHSLLSVERIAGQQPRPESFVVNTTGDVAVRDDNLGRIQWKPSSTAAEHSFGEGDADEDKELSEPLVDVESCTDVPDFVDIESDDVPMDVTASGSSQNEPDAPLHNRYAKTPALTGAEDIDASADDDLDDHDDDDAPTGPAGALGANSAASATRRRPSAPYKLERSAAQVLAKFAGGCECNDNCFTGLNADAVFRHRLNVAELTREEHDMYLMGVTMACLANPDQTHRNRERQRQRASYVYKGKRVCLDAFLYLENVTQYQLKRIRHHVMTQGVVPRVHGNMGKKPHNTFSLDMYKCAEHFVRRSIAAQTGVGGAEAAGTGAADTAVATTTTSVQRPIVVAHETRSSMYEKFKQSALHPEGKIMGYTTFRHFIKKQFPNVRFAQHSKETGAGNGGTGSGGAGGGSTRTPKKSTGRTKTRS